MFAAGPGSYNHTTKFLKRQPSACMGNAKRVTSDERTVGRPGPSDYNRQKKFSELVRSNSLLKNAPRATIGMARSPTRGGDKEFIQTPGPSNYNTITKKQIGDAASVKVVFASA